MQEGIESEEKVTNSTPSLWFLPVGKRICHATWQSLQTRAECVTLIVLFITQQHQHQHQLGLFVDCTYTGLCVSLHPYFLAHRKSLLLGDDNLTKSHRRLWHKQQLPLLTPWQTHQDPYGTAHVHPRLALDQPNRSGEWQSEGAWGWRVSGMSIGGLGMTWGGEGMSVILPLWLGARSLEKTVGPWILTLPLVWPKVLG